MKKTSFPLILGLAAAGLVCGYAGKRAMGIPASEDAAAAAERRPMERSGRRASAKNPEEDRGRIAALSDPSQIRSSDTLDSLKSVVPGELYGRLALWMLDAEEEDIAAWWQHYRNTENRSNDINDLIFIHWTRLDPRGALAAAAGTPDEHYAWWAWSCHDPGAALAAAIAENPHRINNVTWGIGEFHPDWLMEHLDRLPEGNRRNALLGLAKWDDVADPEKVLNFLKEQDFGFHPGIFRNLVRKDPWAAYDWVQQNGGNRTEDSFGGSAPMGEFLRIAAADHPEMLERVAEQTPSGALKRQMEAALFGNLLESDPQAAKERALATKAPKIAEERLAAIGLHLMKSDPDQAFDMAERLFAVSPRALDGMTHVSYEGGLNSWGSSASTAAPLVEALLAKDPDRTMELMTDSSGGAAKVSPSFDRAARLWMNQDAEGFSTWVSGREDPAIRDSGARVLVEHLVNHRNFADAAGWAMNLHEHRSESLTGVMLQWWHTSPEEAAGWLDNADLPAAEAERLRERFRNIR